MAVAAAPADYLERIDRELQRIDRIVRDLLDYARPRGADPQPVALRDVVERVLRLARPQARFRSLELELEDGAEGIVARADEHALGQVILNLLQNAADAMGGAGTIRVAIGRDASRATLRVIDRGPGIPAADLPKIFDPFFTTKAPGKGTGLGLPLCQGWLEAMGGSLHASNRPEGGAELRIELPAIERA